MSTIRQTLLFTLLFSALPLMMGAQVWKDMIAEGRNFYDIEVAANAYFEEFGTGRGSGAKQYTRWARFNAPRTYPSGILRNQSAIRYHEVQKLRRSLPQQMQRSTHGNWENIGPFDYYQGGGGGAMGRVNRLTFHPTLTNTYWGCTAAGGLWKTTDNGSTWTPESDGLPTIGASGLCIDPTNTDVRYLLTGDGDGAHTLSVGVLKTTDGGENWLSTGLSWGLDENVLTFKLVMHPDSSNVLLAATTKGIWRSNDAAETWVVVDTFGNNTYQDLEFAPGAPNIIYAAANNQALRRSTDHGFTWTTATGTAAPGSYTRMEIEASPSVSTNVYALCGGGPTGFAGLFKSTDYGATFTMMSNTPNIMSPNADGSGTANQAGYDIAMAVDPVADSVIYVGGINVWKSTDDGTTWELKTDWRRIIPFIAWIHADIHDLQFRGSTLFAANDGGVFKSENGGDDWDDLSSDLAITQFYYIDINDNDYVGGSQDNGTYGASVTDPQATGILDGDGFAAIYHYGNTSIQYISNQSNKVRRQFGSNATITPSWLTPSGAQTLFWDEDMDMHTSDPDYLFMGNWELFRGNGNAIEFNWDSCYTTFSCASGDACRITTITQGIDNDDIMYVSNEQEVLRSTNINSSTPTWTTLTMPSSRAVTDVLVDPADATRIWASFSGFAAGEKVYYSPDTGSTWIDWSGSLPNVPANCLFYEPGSADGIYVGTDIGVFYRNENMSDWIFFSNGLPSTIVSDMDIEGGYLYVGTFGRGIWRTETYSSCPATLVLTPANDPATSPTTGVQTYHASQWIETTRIVQGGTGTDVNYNAAHFVDLKTGFWSKYGSRMRAMVEGCPD